MMLKNQVSVGDPDIYYYRKGPAFANFDLSKFDQVHITGIPLALTEKTRKASLKLVKKARITGVYVSYDPNLRPSLWPGLETMITTTNEMVKYCDLFLPGNNEGKILMGSDTPEEIAKYYLELGIKLGSKGTYYANKETSFTVECFKVTNVVATVGASDGFAPSKLGEHPFPNLL